MTDPTLDTELDAFLSDVNKLLSLRETQRLMRLEHRTREEVEQRALVRSLVRQLEDLHYVTVRQLAGTDAAAVSETMGPREEGSA